MTLPAERRRRALQSLTRLVDRRLARPVARKEAADEAH
jgi:hypothetical protein